MGHNKALEDICAWLPAMLILVTRTDEDDLVHRALSGEN